MTAPSRTHSGKPKSPLVTPLVGNETEQSGGGILACVRLGVE